MSDHHTRSIKVNRLGVYLAYRGMYFRPEPTVKVYPPAKARATIIEVREAAGEPAQIVFQTRVGDTTVQWVWDQAELHFATLRTPAEIEIGEEDETGRKLSEAELIARTKVFHEGRDWFTISH